MEGREDRRRLCRARRQRPGARLHLFAPDRDRRDAGQGADGGRSAPRRRQYGTAARAIGTQGMKATRGLGRIAADALTVPERVLLFCVASGTDWQRAGITGETVTLLVVKGLV